MFSYTPIMQTQARLFSRGTSGLGPLGHGLERIELGAGSWLELQRGWLLGDDVLFDQLVSTLPWVHGERRMYDRTVQVPRLVASVPADHELPPLLIQASAQLSVRHDRPVDRISFALYRDGRDSVAFHGDRMGGQVQDCIVAILSLRGPRRFLLRPKTTLDGPRRSRRFELGHGDLLVMGGRTQADFEHGIPKATSAPPRISIMFRSRRS
ncbi:MAG: alpha-ketoglutarate-dependent dioxygenase AlkB [Myxococcales bacterium]|nr:alpha-ketoglutarate-dependent dioxygenase AlkB [Myxococcales bacterium]